MRFRVLDSWRGICALCVAMLHLPVLGHLPAIPFVVNSYLFVDFFFVLSGFVIAHSYGDRLSSAADAARFLLRRFGRLWPLHIFTLLGVVGLETAKWAALQGVADLQAGQAAFTGTRSVPALASNVVLIHSLGLHGGPTWNLPSWSISVEYWTYAAFAVVALLLPGRHRSWAAVAVVAISAAALSDDLVNRYNGLFRCLCGFFAGTLAYEAWQRLQQRPWPAATLLELAGVAGTIAYVSTATPSLALLAPPVFATVVVIFAAEQGALSRMALRCDGILRLGDWSYSIYMNHYLVAYALGSGFRLLQKVSGMTLVEPVSVGGESLFFVSFGNVWLMDGLSFLYAALVVAVSATTYRFIENPGRKWFNSRAMAPATAMA